MSVAIIQRQEAGSGAFAQMMRSQQRSRRILTARSCSDHTFFFGRKAMELKARKKGKKPGLLGIILDQELSEGSLLAMKLMM